MNDHLPNIRAILDVLTARPDASADPLDGGDINATDQDPHAHQVSMRGKRSGPRHSLYGCDLSS